GTKMIHIGKHTRSTIVSKGISAGHGQNSYRGMVKVLKSAENARNYSQCDSLLIGDKCGAHTFPYLEVKNSTARVEHEASISKIGDDQIFYCQQRGSLLKTPCPRSSTASVSRRCRSCRWNLPSKRASCSASALKG